MAAPETVRPFLRTGPKGRAKLQNRRNLASARIRAALEPELIGKMNGTRAAFASNFGEPIDRLVGNLASSYRNCS
jgi:hypothetical protein